MNIKSVLKYPNLNQASPYFPFDYFANITKELLIEAIKGTEELSATEAFNMSRYTGIPFKVLFNPQLIVLDRDRPKHQRMMKELEQKLYEIWEWQKKGSREADIYMQYDRTAYVNLDLDFWNRQPVAYTRYLGVKHQMDDTLFFIRCEQEKLHNKPRGVKKVAK